MKRKLICLVVNGLFTTSMYFAYFKQVSGAENLVTFWTWYMLIMSFFTLSKEIRKKMRERGRTVPNYIEVPYDIAMVCVFIWFGEYLLGSIYLMHFALLQAAYQDKGE